MTSSKKLVFAFLAVIVVVSMAHYGLSQRASISSVPQGGNPSQVAPRDGDNSVLPQYVYFVSCAGRYAKLNMQTNAVTENSIWAASSTAVLGLHSDGKFSGCLINNVQYSSSTNVVYTVVPTEQDTESSTYWVVALKLPAFELLSKAGPFVSLPTLLLSPDSTQLSVEDDNGRFLFQTPDLHPVTNPKALQPLGVSPAARWGTGGIIIDGNAIFSDRGQLLKSFDGNSFLTPAIQQSWKSIEREGAGGKRYVPISYGDSADSRLLFVAGGDTAPQNGSSAGFLVYDLSNDKVLGAHQIPYRAAFADPTHFDTPTVHLVPSRNWVVVEEYAWSVMSESAPVSPTDPNAYGRYKTGKMALYDAIQGTLLRTFQLNPSPGFLGRVIGFSPEGRFMYYGSKDHLYTVDLLGERQVQSIVVKGFSPNQGFPPLAVLFENQ